jgi:hypothetical protein
VAAGVRTYRRTGAGGRAGRERTTRDEESGRRERERVSLRLAAGRFAVSHFSNDDSVRRWRRRRRLGPFFFTPRASERARARARAYASATDRNAQRTWLKEGQGGSEGENKAGFILSG